MTKNLKYLIVLGHYGHMGGAERQAFHYIRHLRQRGASVSVLGWYGDGPLSKPLRDLGCEVYSFPYIFKARKAYKLFNLFQLANYIRKTIKPSYILPFVSINSKVACQIWPYTGAKYVWWNQQDEGRQLYGTQTERKALFNACHITSNSIAGTQFLSRTYSISESKIITYNNGTLLPDLKLIKPYWRLKLGLSGRKMVSMIANITSFKDHETLLKAWMIVQEKMLAFGEELPVLILAGDLSKTSHVNKLKILAFDLELKNIKFIGAISKVDELIYESDLIVHSSIKEGCPNAVCESMALGKTVICTDIPGTRQALDKSLWDSCLCNIKDEHDLAEKIIHFLMNNELTLDVGEKNRMRIKNEFSIQGMCELFDSLIPKIDI